MSSVKAPESDDDDDAEDLTDAADRDEGHGSGQTFKDACAEDPITCLRKIVRTIHSSGDKVENEVDGLYMTLKNQHKTNTYFPSSLQVRASLKV
jgi:hypothetical protein